MTDDGLKILFPPEKDFLSHVRHIFEGNTQDSLSLIPLESDENVFEFFAACNYDTNIATSRLHSILSFGKGFFVFLYSQIYD